MANRYWVGGTGTITNSTTHWSATSGGAPGASFPGEFDVAIFDANSGGGTITFSSTSLILSGFDTRGFTGNFVCDATAGGISIRRTGDVYLRGTMDNSLAPGFVVQFQPIVVNAAYNLNIDGSTNWPVDFYVGSSNSNCTFALSGGTLQCRRFVIQSPTSGYAISCNTNNNNNINALIEHVNTNVFGVDLQTGVTGSLGTSKLTAQRMRMQATSVTSSNADLRIKDRLLNYNGFTCKNLEIDAVAGTDCIIEGRVVTQKISNVNKTVPFRLVLPNISGGNSITTTTFDISGSAGAIVDIRAGASAQYMSLVKTNSDHVINVDYLRFYYVTGSPSTDTWYVGANSSNVGGNPTGLIFANSPNSGGGTVAANSLFFASL